MTAIDPRRLLDAVVDHLEEITPIASTYTAPEDIAPLLADLRDVKTVIGMVYTDVEKILLDAMSDDRQVEVPDLGMVERKRRTKRTKWQHDDLVKTVVARALDERTVDEDTGEYERESEAVARVMRECISFGAGKITGLRARGIQPDEFCEETFDGWSVVLPPRAVDGGNRWGGEAA